LIFITGPSPARGKGRGWGEVTGCSACGEQEWKRGRGLERAKEELKRMKAKIFWGVGTSGMGEDIRKGCRRVNVVEMLCTHV
jgi:hypothetical protein